MEQGLAGGSSPLTRTMQRAACILAKLFQALSDHALAPRAESAQGCRRGLGLRWLSPSPSKGGAGNSMGMSMAQCWDSSREEEGRRAQDLSLERDRCSQDKGQPGPGRRAHFGQSAGNWEQSRWWGLEDNASTR